MPPNSSDDDDDWLYETQTGIFRVTVTSRRHQQAEEEHAALDDLVLVLKSHQNIQCLGVRLLEQDELVDHQEENDECSTTTALVGLDAAIKISSRSGEDDKVIELLQRESTNAVRSRFANKVDDSIQIQVETMHNVGNHYKTKPRER